MEPLLGRKGNQELPLLTYSGLRNYLFPKLIRKELLGRLFQLIKENFLALEGEGLGRKA